MPSRMRLLPFYLLAAWICGISHAQAQKSAAPNHPVVLGFERFFAGGKGDVVIGGQLLLGELNCLSCHKAEPALEAWVLKKQAPILDGVGGRIRVSFLKSFLKNPQEAKPGTAMPNVLAGLPEVERQQSIDALVQFLAATGTFKDTRLSPKSMGNGKRLFTQVGCAACHGPQEQTLKEDAAILPLGDLSKKYSIVGLAAFLLDPLKHRPSARMPILNLTAGEAQDIAHYLLRNSITFPNRVGEGPGGVNVRYAYYELSNQPDILPDFSKLKPNATGNCIGFDLGQAQRLDNVAMKFETLLKIDRQGTYTFHVMSDDGSKLWVGKKLAVDNDGIHAPAAKDGRLKLAKGVYPLTLGVFNAGGGYELEADIEGPGVPRQPLSNFVMLATETVQKKPSLPSPDALVPDAKLVNKGRELFATLGCASCHNLKEGQTNIASMLKAPNLANLKVDAGCLAATPGKGVPHHALSSVQRGALVSALAAKLPAPPPSAKQVIAQVFTTFNCYGCHQRDGKGGVQRGLNDFFQTTQKEMGDEGRIPPHLNGVGGKLTPDYLKKVLTSGESDRPYMLTRMPKFGFNNIGVLQAALQTTDPVPVAAMPVFKEPDKKVKSAGRFMVGNKAFGCIKCHNFREYQSGGVRGINMTIMTTRLRREWFTQYLLDPNKYRPGTRMPTGWPLGQSTLPNVLNGDTGEQIEAIWRFLADGNKAALPYGVGREPIPLIPENTALIYRNFIEGAGSRAIGVGYPEKINLAFDANDLRYAMLWHKEFMDASRHWTDRGSGYQPPLGEGILHLPAGPGVAFLKGKEDPWPAKAQKDKGYHFHGYHLDDKLRPTFLYSLGDVAVEDYMVPVQAKDDEHFQRTVTLTTTKGPDNLWFRAASGSKVQDVGNGWYAIDSELKVRLDSPANQGALSKAPVIRTSAGKMELLVPIHGEKTKIVEELAW